MPAKRRPHWRKLEWVSGSRLNAPGITIHAHNRKSTIKNTRPSTVIILPNGNSLASSDGSGMDPFHRERDITSRIINNAPYASHKRWQAEPLWKSPPRAMVQSPGAPEAATGARASETFTSVSQRSQLWPNFVTTCTKHNVPGDFSQWPGWRYVLMVNSYILLPSEPFHPLPRSLLETCFLDFQ